MTDFIVHSHPSCRSKELLGGEFLSAAFQSWESERQLAPQLDTMLDTMVSHCKVLKTVKKCQFNLHVPLSADRFSLFKAKLNYAMDQIRRAVKITRVGSTILIERVAHE